MSNALKSFRYIHKAIRQELDEMEALALAALDGGASDGRFGERLAFLRSAVQVHAAGEDEVMYPALDGRVPQVSRSYALDHDYEEKTFEAMAVTLAELGAATTDERRRMLHQHLYRQSVALNATLSLHIWKEEDQLLPLQDTHFSAAEQGAMAGKIISHIPPPMMLALVPWMLKALTVDERVDFLHTVFGAAPDGTAPAIKAAIKTHLAPAEWSDLAGRLPQIANG